MDSEDEEILVDEEPSSPADLIFRDCEKVINAGVWLIRNGYGRLGLLPYASPSGCSWRCEFHPIGRPGNALFRYSTGSGAKYLQDHCGGTVRRNISPKGLARAIMVSVPEDLKERCAGEVTEQMEEWLKALERALSQRWIPEAFHEYSSDDSRWDLVSIHGALPSTIEPQPGYVTPGTEPTWREEPFWRSCAANAHTLRDIGPFTLNPALIDKAITDEIATETFRAMRDAGRHEAPQIIQMAVGAVLLRLRGR